MQLDALDRRVIDQLGEDGRRSYARIAAALGVSTNTVKLRIERLRSTGVCRVLGVVNPEKLGYGTDVFLGLKIAAGRAAAVEEALSGLAEAYWIAHTVGSFDMLVELVVRSPSEAFAVMARELSPLSGLVAMESFLVTHKTWWRPMEWRPPLEGELGSFAETWDVPRWTGGRAGAQQHRADRRDFAAPVQLDDIDYGIITLLQEDGRRSAVDVAQIVGAGHSTVKRRIDALLETGVCKVLGVISPQAAGFSMLALIGLTVDPAKMVAVAEALVRLPQVLMVSHLIGRFGLLIEVRLRDANELFEFIPAQLRPIPGVQSSEAIVVTSDIPWRPSTWRPPDSPIFN